MRISPENAARAVKMVGLDRPEPIRADDRDALIVKASRLAQMMDRLDQPLPSDVELPPLKRFDAQ